MPSSIHVGIFLLLSCLFAAQEFSDKAFLVKGAERTQQYGETFHDLTADETTTIRYMDVFGNVASIRTVVSSLIIYRSQTDSQASVEYRDVESVDGKPVKDHSKRALKLLEGITDAKTAADELQRITKEGSRYNQHAITINMTLHEGLPFRAECRHVFVFNFVGVEEIHGIPTRAYRYEQAKPCAPSQYRLGLPAEYENGAKTHTGIIWLEADTARLVREQRNVMAESTEHPGRRVKVVEATFDYKPSAFDIMVPDTIDIIGYRVRNRDKQVPNVVPNVHLTQTYGPFSRFEVTTQQHVVYPGNPPD
jgi:hypothetical protein